MIWRLWLYCFPTRRSSDFRRGRADQQHVDAAGVPAGFLDQLAPRRGLQGVLAEVVADQAGGHLDGARAQRHAVLLDRSEEHTSELQSRENLVCRLLLEKKN